MVNIIAQREIYDFEREWLKEHPYRLSRKFEEEMPEFPNHDEARKYFEGKFEGNFLPSNVDIIDGKHLYFYDLVVHRENYDKFKKDLLEKGFYSGMDGALSYHPVEIWEDGRIHIVY